MKKLLFLLTLFVITPLYVNASTISILPKPAQLGYEKTTTDGITTLKLTKKEGSAAKTIIDVFCFFMGLSYATTAASDYYKGNTEIAQRSGLITLGIIGAGLLNHLVFTKIINAPSEITFSYKETDKQTDTQLKKVAESALLEDTAKTAKAFKELVNC
jgi:hypothetical protein